MASSGADRAGSLPQKEYGSCMAMTQAALCHRNSLELWRLDVSVAMVEAQMFLLMLGSLYVVGDISLASFFFRYSTE